MQDIHNKEVPCVKATSPKKLGSLRIGERGTKDFGDFTLAWKVNQNHLEWALNETIDPHECWLAGTLKPAAWNRIEVHSEESILSKYKSLDGTPFKPAMYFEISFDQWPMLRQALDFVVNELADRIHPRWEKP